MAAPPGSRTRCFRACQGSPTPPGLPTPRPTGANRVAFRVLGARRHPASTLISGLNTLPARSPVNASPQPSPTTTHDSGPGWLAKPSLSETSTPSHLAGFPGTPQRQLHLVFGSFTDGDKNQKRRQEEYAPSPPHAHVHPTFSERRWNEMAIPSLDIVVYAGLRLRAHVSGSDPPSEDRSARRPGTDRGVPAHRLSSAQREKSVLAAREIRHVRTNRPVLRPPRPPRRARVGCACLRSGRYSRRQRITGSPRRSPGPATEEP
jgi:hypothetical protein